MEKATERLGDGRSALAGRRPTWWSVAEEGGAVTRFLRQIGLGLVVIYLVVGAGSVTGAAFHDRGGWRAVALSLGWLAPLGALVALAWWWPVWASRLLVVAAAAVVAVVAWGALRPGSWTSWEADTSPINAIALLTVAAPLGFLGWWRPVLSGSALMVLGTTATVAAALSTEVVRPGILVAATAPALVAGILYVLSAGAPPWRTRPDARRGSPAGGGGAAERPSSLGAGHHAR